MYGASYMKRVGKAVQSKASAWYTPFMAAASRAIAQRIPLVDFVLDVRDARIPMSSECGLLSSLFSSSRRIIVMNKMDLAKRSDIKDWMRYFEHQNFAVFGVNSHNKDNIKEFLKFIQGEVRALQKADAGRHTITMMLAGIPNVGKSAISNSLHQIGRISAAEKGKLKHVVVTPSPGDTKNITSLKVASHPNVYVLDTPGILSPQMTDIEVCSKLALTGALRDDLVGEKALAQYFLAILNLSDEHQKWSRQKFCGPSKDDNVAASGEFEFDKMRKKKYLTDHTQDFMVCEVRGSLFEAISSFQGNVQDEEDLQRLIEEEFMVLKGVFCLPNTMGEEESENRVAAKLLNLFRTGRLGHFTLDSLPGHAF